MERLSLIEELSEQPDKPAKPLRKSSPVKVVSRGAGFLQAFRQ